ncbi:MAG: DUF2997 domain-containing protein [Planctomycetaceae bacterium]|nr:DUF2997 domain-containing protein [Planctomycetaceae bacterium]
MKRIEIIVQPDGQTQVQTKGFAGPECRQASEFIEKVLGQRTSEQLTPEFHQTTNTQTSQQQQE